MSCVDALGIDAPLADTVRKLAVTNDGYGYGKIGKSSTKMVFHQYRKVDTIKETPYY
jgi:hypothetical protein